MKKTKLFLVLSSLFLAGGISVVSTGCAPGEEPIVDVTASYTVKHMKQNLTGSEYTLADTEALQGSAGQKTEGVAKTYEGFEAQAFEQVNIAEDGSTELVIKYDRKILTVTLDVSGGTDVSPVSVRYGTKLADVEFPTVTRKGYYFVKWTHSDGSEIGEEEIATESLTLKAEWNPIIVGYSVQHLKQNVTGDEYTLADTDNLEGQAYSLTAGVAKTYEGFTLVPFDQVEIKEDGSTILQIKYDRNIVKVNINTDGGEAKDSLDVRYGTKVADIELPVVTRTGYNFVKWIYNDGSDIGENDVLTSEITLKAVWDAIVSNVTVSGLGVDQKLTAKYGVGLSGDLDKPEIHAVAKVNGTVTDLDKYDWTKVTQDTKIVYELDQTNGDYDLKEKLVTLGNWGNLLLMDTQGVFTIEARVEGNNQSQLNGGFQVVDSNGMILNLVSCMNTNGVAWVTAVLGDGTSRQFNLFTPENGLGQEATLPSIPVEFGGAGEFVEGNYVGIKMSLTYDADNSKLTYSLINEKTKTTTKVIDMSINDLMTRLELTSFDLSKGVVGFYHRNEGCSMYAGNVKFVNDSVICRHEGGHYAATAYSCTTPGNSEFYECEECGEIFLTKPEVGTFEDKDIKDYAGLDEHHLAYIAPKHTQRTDVKVGNNTGLLNNKCAICGAEFDSYTFGANGDDYIDIDNWWDVNTVNFISFHVDKPDHLPADNCQGVGIVDDINGWAEKSQFRLGISYYQWGRQWFLTYGNFQTFTSFADAGICGSETDAFPEDGLDLAYVLKDSNLTMYYKLPSSTTWSKWRSINNDLEGGTFSNYIERIYAKMEMTISDVYCSNTSQINDDGTVSNRKITVSGLGCNQQIEFAPGTDISSQITLPSISRYTVTLNDKVIKDYNDEEMDFDFTKLSHDAKLVFSAEMSANSSYNETDGTTILGSDGYAILENTSGSFSYKATFETNDITSTNIGFFLRDKNGNQVILVTYNSWQDLKWVTGKKYGSNVDEFNLFTPENGLGQTATIESYRSDGGQGGIKNPSWFGRITETLVYDDVAKTLSLILDSDTSGEKLIKTWTVDEFASSLNFDSLDFSTASIGFYQRGGSYDQYAFNVSLVQGDSNLF